LPVGSGDAIVLWATTVRWYGLFGVLLVVPVLALVFGYMSVSTSAGRIGVVAGMGALIALPLSGLIAAVTSRSRMEVSTGMIVYITAADNTLTLYRESGNALLIVRAGSPRPGLTARDADTVVLPIGSFSASKLRRACAARDWQFPDSIDSAAETWNSQSE
jgi:hypothetical protein